MRNFSDLPVLAPPFAAAPRRGQTAD